MEEISMKTVSEIANMFSVSIPAVRYWLNHGLVCEKETYVGFKKRIIIDPAEVKKHLHISDSDYERIINRKG